jgi:methionyl-tRNA formyltransferase
MQLVEKMDAGPVYLQEEIALAEDETTASLQAKLTPLGARLLLETIRRLKRGDLTERLQNENEVTFAPTIKKEDGLVDWTLPAEAIERRVRGFNPWPGAYTYLDRKLLKIHRSNIVETTRQGNPGEIVKADSGGFWVATGNGTLVLEEVQLENRKRMPGVEFVRGARIEPGKRL